MNEELKKLYDAIASRGFYTKSYGEFVNQYQDPAYRDKLFSVVTREGLYTKSREEFDTKYSAVPLKKKDPSVSTSQEAATAPPMEAGSLELPKPPEEQDYFTGAFGDVLRGFDNIVPLGFGDFVDDMARSVASGYRQGEAAQQADKLLLQGAKSTPEQIQKFIDANKNIEALGSSAEMQDYQRIYEEEGKSFWGVVKGLANNPSIIPEVIYSSLTAMLTNTDALKAGAAAVGTGAVGGAAAGAPAGGVGAIPGLVAGAAASVPYAFGLASSVVEMGATFGELIQEDLGDEKMTKENVKAILENPEKLNSIRNRAIARGAIIGTVDAFTGKLASGVGAKIISKSAAKSASGAATKAAVTKATGAGSVIEGAGGSLGEATARAAIGQEMDMSEIALEGIAELPGGIRSTIQARFAKASYKVNGEKVSAEQIDELTSTMSPAELAETKIEIKNDYEGREFKIQDKIETNTIKEQVRQGNPDLNEPSLNAITELEKELKKLSGNTTQTAKNKVADIKAQIQDIQENQIQEQTADEAPVQLEATVDQEVAQPITLDIPALPGTEAVAQEPGTVGTLLNERVVYDDPVSGQPVEGDLFADGQRLVLEAADGQQFDLGNVDEMTGQPIEGGTLRPAEMAVLPQQDGSLVFNKEGNQKVAKGTKMFNRKPGLKAIRRDSQGKVSRVVLSSEDGKETYNLTGQEAQDAAYYIMRGFVETQEGQDIINQLSERNEEARRDLAVPIPVAPAVEAPAVRAPSVQPVQQAATSAAVAVRDEVPAGTDVEVDTQELADLRAEAPGTSAKRVERIKRVAERARKAIARIMPDVKIIIHDTQQAYEAATSDTEQASYIGRTIHINATKATPSAVAHEVFHAVFLDRVKTDAKAQEAAKRMVESLKRVLGKDSEVYQYLNEFSKNYDSNLRNEEKLAEMVAVLAEFYSGVNDIGLSTSAVQSVKNIIKKFITDVAKIFNIPMSTTLTDADVMAVLNAIAQKTVTGEVITEADVQAIDRMVSEDIGSAESLLVNQGLAVPPSVSVKKRQRISAQTNEEARASLDKKARMIFPSSTDDALTIDEMRVYHMNDDFSWIKDSLYFEPYENVANLLTEIISKPDVHMFPSPTMRGGFMVVDESAAVPQVEMNIHLSPRKDNVVYIEGIELFDAKLSNSGAGTRLMNRLTSAADKLGLTLKLDAYPTRKFQYDREKKRDISDKQLDKMADRLVTDFYSKFGFYSPKNNTNRAARSMERKPITDADVNQIRQRKGLITITEREAMKYARIGINDARVAQAMEDIGLAGVRFTKGDVNVAIENAFNTAIQDIRQTDMYNGQPAVITQDSPAITRAIEAEIVALEEQGASISRIESAKRMIEDKETRFRYIKNYQDAQTETLSQWISYLSQSPYDPAFKMLMLDAVVTNNYDLSIDKYIKRDNKTIRNITPFDAGALAQLYGMTDSKELLKTYTEIQSDNAENVVKSNEVKSTKDGKWLKFNGGENTPQSEREVNAVALSQLVQDTYWCTKTNASSQLDGGDFYVYATKDKSGKYRSRIAVRMDGDDVGEVRGNASSKQDVEADMLPVAEKFLREEIPNDSGKKWLDSIAFNKKAKAFAESISDKKLSMDMIKEFGILSGDASKYSVDYGKNGFIERIENIIKLKASEDDVTADLKGKVATRGRDLGPNTSVFIGYIDPALYEDFAVGLEVVISDVTIGGDVGIDKVSLPPKLKSIYGNVTMRSSDNVDFSALENIYGDLYIGVEVESLGNIKVVSGNFDISMREGTGSSLEDLGKIEVINSKYGFEIPSDVKELKYLKTINGSFTVNSSSSLESLGSLEVVNGRMQIGGTEINSLGKLQRVSGDAVMSPLITKIDGVSFGDSLQVFNGTEIVNVKTIPGDFVVSARTYDGVEHSISGSIEEVGGYFFATESTGTSLGNLKTVGKYLGAPDSLKSLGKLNRIGESANIFSKSIKSLGDLEYVGGELFVSSKNLLSLGNLKYVGGNLTLSLFSPLNSLGKLGYVGGLMPMLKDDIDMGSLSSVGGNWISRFKNDTGENVNIAGIASIYVEESALFGRIKDKVFDLVLKQASVYFGVELPPAPRQRKGDSVALHNWSSPPTTIAQKVGHMYNMKHNGYTNNAIINEHFKRDVERIDSRLSVRPTSTGSGYYMTLDGKFFNPYLKAIGGKDGGPNAMRRRMGQPNENIFDIVTMARQRGYTDKTITAYLREEGFAPNDIIDALKVNSNIEGTQVPQEFGNVTGGMAQGQNLFDDIKAQLAKMAVDGATMAEVRIEAQTLLTESDVYKAQSEEVKAQLRLSLDAAIGTKAADRAFREEFKQLRAMLADRKKARRELETIKRKMRGFIRKNLPQGEYSKAEVVRLLKAIVDANIDTLPVVMERVEGYVTEFKVRKLQSDLKKILATKTTRVESGRQMGSMTIETQEDLAELNEALVDEGMSPQQMSSTLSAQLSEYDALESSYDITDKDARRMQILEISMMYNEAMILEDNDPNKVDSLASARDQLVAMIAMSRADFKAIKAAQSASYKQSVRDMVEAITGEAVPDDIDTRDGLNEFVRKSEVTTANKEAVRSRIVKAWNSFFGKPVTQYFDRTGSLHTLLGRITANITDQFGGRVNEMVYDRLKLASIEFERRMQMLNKSLDAKGREIFGKDYDNVVKNNRVKKPIDIFTDKGKAQRLMNEMKTASSQRKSEINNELNELRVFEPMSQNQIYYLYNQFKDPANRSGFEAKFGEGYVNNLNELFDTSLDPSVKEWADWQVLEFYPSVYETYNDVYKKIFRTNMPWNPNYAGRLYREKESEDNMAITLLDGQGQFSNIQTPSSTKMRKANSNPVKIMDGDMVLTSYLGDMEYFRAYGETIRDVDKLFRNKAVQESVKKTAGEDILGLIKDYIKIVGTNGTSLGVSAKQTTLDNTASRFSRAVLMANPSQLIKQATSLFAFANRIGFEKWVAFTAKAAPQMGSLWSEFMDNAPRIQKRYNPRELTAIIGTYKPGRTSELMPKDKDGSPILRKAGEVYDKALDALMWPVIQGDKFSAMAGAMGNYLYYKETFMQNNPSATKEQAIKFAADKVSTEIEQTLGSADVIDKDFYQNSGNALYRAFSVLQNSPKAMIRQLVPAYSGLFKKISKMDKSAGVGTLKQNIETVLLFQFLVPMLFQYAVLGLPGLLREWRDDDDEEMGMAALLGPFTALFFIGDLLSMSRDLILDKPWATDARTAPGWDILSDAGKSVNKLMKADSDDKVIEALSEIGYSLSAAAGLGLKNISRMAQNIAEVVDDGLGSGESILRLFNYSDYTIEGPDREK